MDPATQGSGGAAFPELVRRALREGWNVPDDAKARAIDELSEVVLDPDMPAWKKIAAFTALRVADQTQYERDHPEQARKGRRGR